MVTIQNYIDGSFQPAVSGRVLENRRPRDGLVFGSLPASTKGDVDLAVTAARRAFPAWRKTSRQERAHWLRKIADTIEQRLDLFVAAESEDQGKPEWLARRVDIPRAVENFRFFAGAILHQEESAFESQCDVLNYTLRQPLGVAGLISPWNLPLYLLTWKIAPALACGNAVVAKPSELTPYTAHLLAQVLADIEFPRGVCNIVHGLGSEVGDALVGHPDVPLVSFTGGTATAQKISERAAPFAKKLSLELGGKNPALIFADCALDAAVETTLRSSFTNQGEICLCTSRIFIERSLWPRFSEAFLAGVHKLRVGDPRREDTKLGALVSEAHRFKVDGFVQRAVKAGAKLLAGGKMASIPGELSAGYYYEPTVLFTEDPTLEIMQEEVFGPVVTVSLFENYDEALSLANSTRYGLAATIWTQNLSVAHRAAAELDCGLVWVNTWMNRDLRVPFGGNKASGVGREGGRHSLEFYTEEKNICLQL